MGVSTISQFFGKSKTVLKKCSGLLMVTGDIYSKRKREKDKIYLTPICGKARHIFEGRLDMGQEQLACRLTFMMGRYSSWSSIVCLCQVGFPSEHVV